MDWKVIADLLVIAAYFAAILGIGLYFSRRNASLHDFALGGRSIPWWAVLASILAAEISAGTFFGTPGEGHRWRNFTYAQLLIGYLLARVVVSAVFIPAYYRHNVVSIYEFLETRFGPRTRRMASAVFLFTRVLASGARLWVPTVLLLVMWHLAFPGEKIGALQNFALCGAGLVIITVLAALYTAIGGIKAVIWTDVIQVCVLICAIGFSLWFLLRQIDGGWAGATVRLTGEKDLLFAQWSGNNPSDSFWGSIKSVLETPYTMWAAFLGSLFTTMATHGTDQDMVQRMLTAKDKRQSAMATILSGVADLPIVFAVLAIGILLSVYYSSYGVGDAMLLRDTRGKVDSSLVFPYFVLTEMPGGLRGLVIAGVLATTMGSLGTALNSLATSYVRDFHFRWFGEPPTEAGKVRTVRRATFVFAVFLILVGLGTAAIKAVNPDLSIIPIILSSFGYTYGSLLGVYLVALFLPGRGNDRGNIIAMIAGFIGIAWLSGLDQSIAKMFIEPKTGAPPPGIPRPDWMPVLSFSWWIMFGTVITFAVATCFKSPAQKRPDSSGDAGA
jgi:solute:Na+ symporter, SSS family